MAIKRAAAVVGIGQTDWLGDYEKTKKGERPADSYGYGARAFVNALSDAGIDRSEIDGLIVGPTTAYERMGEILGLETRWGGQADAVQAMMQAVHRAHANTRRPRTAVSFLTNSAPTGKRTMPAGPAGYSRPI